MGEQEPTDHRNSKVVVFSAVIASIGGVLFGYDIGIISGALLQLKQVFSLSAFEQELVVSGVIIGAFCASFFGGNIVDSWGRKAGIVVSCVFFIAGSVILCTSINFVMLVIGRFIVGIAVSLSVTAECTYISEISPPSIRGMMVSLNEVGITTGFLFAYLVNYLMISHPDGWKYMFGIAAIPAVLQVLGVFLLPSSHHYLLVKGKTNQARKVLRYLRNTDDVEEEIEAIVSSISEQKNRRYVDLFSSELNMRSRMVLGMALVFLQQFSGNANVLYYAPTVFQHFGYSTDTAATLVSVGLGIVKVLATVITVVIVDKVGRRSLLLFGTLLMATSIIVLGILGTVEHSHIAIPEESKIISQSSYNLDLNKKEVLSESKELGADNFLSGKSNFSNSDFSIERSKENNETIQNTNTNETNSEEENINDPINSISTAKTNDTNSHLEESINFLFGSESAAKINESNSIEENNIDFPINSTSTVIANETDFYIDETTILPSNSISTFFPTVNENYYDPHNKTFSTNSSYNTTKEETTFYSESVPLSTKIISVISLMVFVCAYSMSYGPVTWLVLSEIFPGSLRGRAVSVATCINWGSNIIVSLTFLDILNAVGIGPTFVTYGFICFAASIFVFLCVPETKNKTLEDINDVLNKGYLINDWKNACTCKKRKYTLKKSDFVLAANYNSMQERVQSEPTDKIQRF